MNKLLVKLTTCIDTLVTAVGTVRSTVTCRSVEYTHGGIGTLDVIHFRTHY